ncbi:hypothetical protein [Streptomyces sp. NPDC049881]|uniref:hypothetical protein n=1 Tax=Streptomyces sp. NPDC049881 TaxID=3155778 RepID=UPI0034198010
MAGRQGRKDRAARRRRWTVWSSFAGGLLCLLAAGWLPSLVPDDLPSERQWLAADDCAPGLWLDTCVGAAVGTVVLREERDGEHWLTVVDLRTDIPADLRMPGPGPVWEAAERGQELTLFFWRGEIRSVHNGSVYQDVAGLPARDWPAALGGALVALPLGGFLLWFAWWTGPSRRTDTRAHPWQVTAAKAAAWAIGSVGVICVEAADSLGEAYLVMGLTAPPVVGVACAIASWRQRRRDRTVATVVPEVPHRGMLLKVRVHGDVPGAIDGLGHLAAGQSPDPALRELLLPPTLTAVRVREFLHDDPEDLVRLSGGRKGVAIECRDGDTPVLLGTRLRDAAFVLGTLAAEPPAPRRPRGARRPV